MDNYDDDDDDDMEEVQLQTDDLTALPPHLREEIDVAFDRAARASSRTAPADESESPRRSKRRRLNPEPAQEDTEGGFMLYAEEGEEPASAGGFLPDEPPEAGGFLPSSSPAAAAKKPSHLPLSSIPLALKLLRLPPDDDDVLSTFREAATGWGEGGGGEEQGVSREDWRAVCAVLIGQREELPEEEEDGEDGEELEEGEEGGFARQEEGEGEEESDLTSSEDWRPEPQAESYSASDAGSTYEEVTTPSKRAGKGKGKGKGRRAPVEELSELTYSDLSSRKKREVREAFELFFEETWQGANGNAQGQGQGKGKGKEKELPPTITRRIGAADVARAAKLLNEKMSPAEIEQMLELFTSTQDGTIGVQEFTKIMIMGNVL
ncbi:hypothetical protein CALVIDRAFT_535103 [Calocera viscosa TUFC12733]|uniref:EF-hand domain-containing protein n=1 Tax=Calocera viscosa (strain TUFC12733) TaxID=1330018 RepID=A0A167P6D4_CALVF|nr:hypothetical protein CALVIDRAFT_535103 [Calocera viscosa TUFC12733]